MNKYDFKNIIKRIIVGVAVALLVMSIRQCKVSALTIKQNVSLTFSTSQEMTGTLTGSSQNNLQYRWSAVSNTSNYDYLAIRIQPYYNLKDTISVTPGNIYFENMSNISITCDISGNGFCNYGHINFPSISYLDPANFNITTGAGDYVLTANVIYSGNNDAEGCFFTSEYQNMIICPFKHDIVGVNLYLSGYQLDSLSYKIYMSGNALAINNESTEIVNGLSGVQQQQQQTNDIISDSNVSGANTSTNNALNGMENNVNSTLNNAISPNELNTLLSGFVNQLNNTTCTPITLPIPYTNENIVLPCLGTEFSQRIPVIWSLYELIITGVIVLRFWQHAVEFVLNILDPYHIGANNVPTGGGK